MAQVFEGLEISSRPATEIQNSIRWFAADMFEKCVTILAYVMILCAFPKILCVLVVMTEGDDRSLRKLSSTEPWSVGCSHVMDNDAARSAGCHLK
jgi:hypothetical protein